MQRVKTIKDPIAEFMQEHEDAVKHLHTLSDATKSLALNGFSKDAFKKVIAGLSYMKREVGDHNKKEENALFPILERYVEGPTKIMRDEHKILYKQFVKFEEAVGTVKKNPNEDKSLQRLVSLSRSIVKIFVNHIHKENYILFPLVQKFLTKEELREVAKKMH
ncbi:MAG: hemerythrin domain-containing protein [Ignavibacteriales bacterium]|nr:hemerythrin domain-containing protein [Ignavibacteriales bacterium]